MFRIANCYFRNNSSHGCFTALSVKNAASTVDNNLLFMFAITVLSQEGASTMTKLFSGKVLGAEDVFEKNGVRYRYYLIHVVDTAIVRRVRSTVLDRVDGDIVDLTLGDFNGSLFIREV